MKKEKVSLIIGALENEYPEAACSLEYIKDYELLIATRLSAQCTDERVNKITPALFAKYRSLRDFAEAEITELEDMIHSCGFYRIKAKDIKELSRMLLEEFGGTVPDNMEDLLRLPGVGRKTANLILGDVYKKPAIVTDTHCIRLANRLGLAASKDPFKVETRLSAVIPPEKQSDFCHRLVLHGRAICSARKPKCGLCVLENCCDKIGV